MNTGQCEILTTTVEVDIPQHVAGYCHHMALDTITATIKQMQRFVELGRRYMVFTWVV
jgi:hypothetical protein